MNLAETTKLLTIMKQNYNNFEFSKDKVEIWQDLLSDIDSNVIFVALKKHLAENESGFAPQIATLRRMALSITNPSTSISAGESWGEVTRAISNFGWSNEIKALESMSEITRKVVKSIGLKNICLSEELGVIRGQFNRYFEGIKDREIQDKLIPDSMKQILASLVKEIPKLEPQEMLQLGEYNQFEDENTENLEKAEIPQAFKDALNGAFDMNKKSDDGTELKRQRIIEQIKKLEGEQTE